MTDEQIRRMIIARRRKKARRRRIIAVCIVSLIAIADGYFIGRAIGKSYTPKFVSTAEDLPIINTAAEQIGNVGGEKFWSWYGFDSHVSWCACFVSWCEDQCGYQDKGIGTSFAVVTDGIDWFKARDQWLEPDETPSAGDFIFFDWEDDGYRDHVGIVSRVVGDKIFTIEGNSSDRCRMKRYTIGDRCIEGYGHVVQEEEAEKE